MGHAGLVRERKGGPTTILTDIPGQKEASLSFVVRAYAVVVSESGERERRGRWEWICSVYGCGYKTIWGVVVLARDPLNQRHI